MNPQDVHDSDELSQIAQVQVNGTYLIDVLWFQRGQQIYLGITNENVWISDNSNVNILATFSLLFDCNATLDSLVIIQDGSEVFFAASDIGIDCSTWQHYAEKKQVLQFNVVVPEKNVKNFMQMYIEEKCAGCFCECENFSTGCEHICEFCR